jgi:phosphatidylglycerophosphate synthase
MSYEVPSGRKIPRKYEAIVDDYLISICDPVADTLHKCSFTPNMITTIGLFVGILSGLCLYKHYYFSAIVLLWFCYWLDCLDGHYARKYKMESTFGDYYDHFRDVFVFTLFAIILLFQLRTIPFKMVFIISLCLGIYLMSCQIGCQEKNSKYTLYSNSLNMFTQLCPSPMFVRISRIAGCSIVVIIMTIFVLLQSSHAN